MDRFQQVGETTIAARTDKAIQSIRIVIDTLKQEQQLAVSHATIETRVNLGLIEISISVNVKIRD